jgi:hypothetical protein
MESVVVCSAAYGGLPVSQVTAKARQLFLSAGVARSEGSVSVRPLDDANVSAAVKQFPLGCDREGPNLILMDAAAMCAYGPYRTTVLAAEDPFGRALALAKALQRDVEDVRLRIHRAFCNAAKIVSLGRAVAASLQPFLPQKQEVLDFPPAPLVRGTADKQILTVIHPGSEELGEAVLASLNAGLPDWEFVLERTDVFELPWYGAIHVGPATSIEPGSRLPDCWAGGVPVFQIANRESQRARALDPSLPLFVTDGRNGRLCGTVERLLTALQEFAADSAASRHNSLLAQSETDWLNAWARIAVEVLQ